MPDYLRAPRAYVPIDDESCVKWQIAWYPTRSIMETTQERARASADEEAYAPATP